MAVNDERREALRMLDGLERGRLSVEEAALIAEDLDPLYIYVIVSFLRAIHPASDPAAATVLERVVKLTSASPTVVRKHREGGQDAIAEWFESEYEYRDFYGKGDELIGLIAHKIDS